MSGYFDGLNAKLLQAVPVDARRVLELGCANGNLGRAFKARNRSVQWWGVDVSSTAVRTASAHLDRVFEMDLDNADLSVLGGDFDVVVIGDLIEHLKQPERLLADLYDLTTSGARVVCCLPNMAHLSVIQRLLAGDITYDEIGLLDRTHTRLFSPSSAIKTFLDAGWLPQLSDSYRVEAPVTEFFARLVGAAHAIGVSAGTALRNLGLYQMILSCSKWDMSSLLRPGVMEPFSVIVPVTRAWQHELNIAKSPGLKEVGADVVCVQGADCAASAYEAGSARAKHRWRLMLHQDVYLPRGSGYSISRQLGGIELAGHSGAPVGFAGLRAASESDPSQVAYAGMVVDRINLFSHGPTKRGVSIDEFAVALPADTSIRIDPSLGWHLWGTDLCLQAMISAGRPDSAILDVPLFHNSTSDFTLPPEFYASADRLVSKYPQFDRIHTLCGELKKRHSVSG